MRQPCYVSFCHLLFYRSYSNFLLGTSVPNLIISVQCPLINLCSQFCWTYCLLLLLLCGPIFPTLEHCRSYYLIGTFHKLHLNSSLFPSSLLESIVTFPSISQSLCNMNPRYLNGATCGMMWSTIFTLNILLSSLFCFWLYTWFPDFCLTPTYLTKHY